MVEKIPAAVLGATGLVGQRFVSLLAGHPWFELVALTASEARRGRPYGEEVNWVLGPEVPREARDLVLRATKPEELEDAEVVFVALPKTVAARVEEALAEKGKIVVSNASNMRLEPDIPLLNPEVNHEHIQLLEAQARRRGWRGAILKVPNCSTAVLTLAVKPLADKYGIEELHVTTLQAISGAGYSGVTGYQITDNVIPYIRGEEEKLQRETRKILGRLQRGAEGPLVKEYSVRVYATTTRVPVLDGHLESIHLILGERPGSREEVEETLSNYKSLPQELGLPTAPEKPVIVRGEPDRPQPRLDRMNSGGMSVTVGRVRVDGRVVRLVALGHNTIRGAAGTGVLIAELYYRINGLV